MSIAIVRAFISLKQLALQHKGLAEKLEDLLIPRRVSASANEHWHAGLAVLPCYGSCLLEPFLSIPVRRVKPGRRYCVTCQHKK
jgi:hypothetical protein